MPPKKKASKAKLKPKASTKSSGKTGARTKARAKVRPKAKAAVKAKTTVKTKATAKAKAVVRAKPAPKAKKAARPRVRKVERKRPPSLATVAVGDAVRISADERNLIGRYDAKLAQDRRGGEGIEGIVSSIREIRTGKLVPKTVGDLSGYVLEVVHNQTFRLHYGSDQNTAGPRGPEDVRENPVWQRLRGALRAMADSKRMASMSAGGTSEEPLRSLLDGWRVVKIKAQRLEPMR